MENISIVQFSRYHNIEPQFLIDLHHSELLVLKQREEEYYIEENELIKAERYIQFHYELGINIEGLEVINHLLSQMKVLQNQLKYEKASNSLNGTYIK